MRVGFMAMALGSCLCVSAMTRAESFAEIGARLGADTQAAYEASPFSALSRNYFDRFHRDPAAAPEANETVVDGAWAIAVAADAPELAQRMAGYLSEFLETGMGLAVPVAVEPERIGQGRVIALLSEGGGDPEVPESFTIAVTPDRIEVAGVDANGLRDGVVKLADRMGFRQAPFVAQGEQTYRPRLSVRLGTIPRLGTYRDLVFMGYNAVFAGGGNLHALSVSDRIPELAERRVPGLLEGGRAAAQEARNHGLKTYAFVDTRQKFPADAPVFQAHPDMRGALTWKADGEYVLCTEHPVVKEFLAESVAGIFEADPDLNGLVCIIGGEGFYHCFMRPYGVEKGRTNCARCDALGAETVVANLCNGMARAARTVRPDAEIIIWPYSAVHVWSADPDQRALIEKLEPGVSLLTEIEKDEYVRKPGGVNKHLWDYSIDLIGPGARAARQLAACAERGINVYLKSEPELGFEAARLPHIPCMDRWVDRAEALAACGATGAFVFPAFRPNYGTSASEVAKFVWWDPAPNKDELLEALAARWVGHDAAPHLRSAWWYVSAAIPLMPEIPPYYNGPSYLGPAHPMSVDPAIEVPEVFYGHYLFMAEIADEEGAKTRPTFITEPRGNADVFGAYYRKMEAVLAKALADIEQARPLVPDALRLLFEAEESPIRWYYHTARAQANFYESCQLRDALAAYREKSSPTAEESAEARAQYERWIAVLENERRNVEEAIPVAAKDMRLDWYYGSDHTFPHAADMLAAKQDLLDAEIARVREWLDAVPAE